MQINTHEASNGTTPAPAGHDEAMLAIVDKRNAEISGTPAPADTPADGDLILGKYKTADDLAAAYQALQAEYTKLKQGAPGPAPAPAVSGDTAEAKLTLESKGLDFSQFESEFAEKGALSDQSYQTLEKAGISKATADAYIEGQRAAATLKFQEVSKLVGGEEQYRAIASWAASALSPQDLEAYNAAVSGRDMASIRLAVQGLQAQYVAANGKSPNLIGGAASPTSAGYESMAQMKSDISDPRYSTDPAFRAMVMRKAAASKEFQY